MKYNTVQDLKDALKNEIIRLGIQDNPSRTAYQEQYNNNNAPSPNSAINKSGQTWMDLMNELGFAYNGLKTPKKRRDSFKMGARLTDTQFLRDVSLGAIELIHEKEIVSVNDLDRELRSKYGVTYQNLKNHGYSMAKLRSLYQKKYGVFAPLKKRTSPWDKYDKNELLGIVVQYMQDKNIASYGSYCVSSYKGQAPAPSYLQHRLNVDNKTVGLMVNALM